MTDDIDGSLESLLDDCRERLGCAATDIPAGAQLADWTNISRHQAATGDDNPLYLDLQHGADSWWRGTIAPPGFVLGILTPESIGPLAAKPHDVVEMLARVDLWWNDHIRLGERVGARARLADARWGPSFRERRTLDLTTHVTYTSQERAVATAAGVVRLHPLRLGQELLCERPIHRYSDTEIAHVEASLDNEAPVRGTRALLHSAVHVGDTLPPMVRGPVTWSELITWMVAQGHCAPAGNLRTLQLQAQPGIARPHGATGWSWSDRRQAREDLLACADVGFAAPASRGSMTVALAAQMVTRWMGDDGFLRHLSVTLDEPLLYGDTLFISGHVTRKFTQRFGGREVHAVLLALRGRNQLEQQVFHATAIVLLPEPGHPITLPLEKEND